MNAPSPGAGDDGVARFLLVRHGESTWNAQRRWQGRADPPLTGRGERQALSAAAVVAEVASFDLIITSSLRRARRTGELIANEIGVNLGTAVADLSERDAGAWEGLTRIEIEDRYPGHLAAERRPEGYESDESIVERAGAAIVDLAADRSGATILVVSHGGVINALERHHDEPWLRLDNLEARWFELYEGAPRPVGDRVRLIDDGGPNEHASAPVERGYA